MKRGPLSGGNVRSTGAYCEQPAGDCGGAGKSMGAIHAAMEKRMKLVPAALPRPHIARDTLRRHVVGSGT